MTEIRPVGIVGAGVMGTGIAQLFASAGYDVLLLDAHAGAAEAAQASIAATLNRLSGRGKMDAEAVPAVLARIRTCSALSDLSDAGLVIEAIAEDIGAKHDLIERLESVVDEACIIASNTSSITITSIARVMKRSGRFAGFHFFNPAPVMKLVEIIPGLMTSQATVAALEAVAHNLGQQPVISRDTPGFVVNHIGRAYVPESMRILQEGVAPPEEIDAILRGAGFRMGPFELVDLTGADVTSQVMQTIHQQYFGEPRYQPIHLLRQRADAGLLGRKSGQGFYRYGPDGREPSPLRVEAAGVSPVPVWVGAEDPDWRRVIRDFVRASGWPLDDGATPGSDALCLVTPLGEDATSVACRLGLDATRVIALDMLFGLDTHRSLMVTPVSSAPMAEAARALFSSDGGKVSVLRDSPGFVVQRVVATIVNIGCEIAQQGIASPGDINAAARLGLGYRSGPLEMGDRIGAARILRILETLSDYTREPRYRPSLWLSRRARLDVSLSHPEPFQVGVRRAAADQAASIPGGVEPTSE